MIDGKLIQDMVYDKQDSVLEIRQLLMGSETVVSVEEHLIGFPGDQVVPDVVFVFKIQIESPLGNTGISYDVGDRGLMESIVDKKRKSRFQEGCSFLLFFVVYLIHQKTSFLSGAHFDRS